MGAGWLPSGALNGLCAGCDIGEPPTFHFGFQAAYAYLLPAQAFRRLPRAGASPCTPCSIINHSLSIFRLPIGVETV